MKSCLVALVLICFILDNSHGCSSSSKEVVRKHISDINVTRCASGFIMDGRGNCVDPAAPIEPSDDIDYDFDNGSNSNVEIV